MNLGIISYESKYEKSIEIPISVVSDSTYSIEICLDSLDFSKERLTPIISKLKIGESYSIHMSSQGCFHSGEDELILKRESVDEYSAKYNDSSYHISIQQLKFIKIFEFEIRYLSFGCTTEDTYTITYKNKSKEYVDGSCEWHGFDILLHELNIIKIK